MFFIAGLLLAVLFVIVIPAVSSYALWESSSYRMTVARNALEENLMLIQAELTFTQKNGCGEKFFALKTVAITEMNKYLETMNGLLEKHTRLPLSGRLTFSEQKARAIAELADHWSRKRRISVAGIIDLLNEPQLKR